MAFEPLTLSGAATKKVAPPSRQPNFPGFKGRLLRVFNRLMRKAGLFAALISLQWFVILATALAALSTWQQHWPSDNWTTSLVVLELLIGVILFLGLLAGISAVAAFKTRLGQALAIGFSRVIGLVSAAALALLASGAAALALVLPGLLVMFRSALLLPTLLAEDLSGTKLLSRSYGLVRGRTLALGLQLFILSIWTAALATLIELAAGMIPGAQASDSAFRILGADLSWDALVVAGQILVGLIGLAALLTYLQIYYEDAVENDDQRTDDAISRLYGWLAAGGALLLVIGLAAPTLLDRLPRVTTSKTAAVAELAKPEKIVDPAEERDWERYRAMNVLRIGLNSYQSSNKNYPARLEDLVGPQIEKLPLDPSSAQPYAYELIPGGYRISFTLEKGLLALAPGGHILSARGFDIPLQVRSEPTATAPAADTEQPATSEISDVDSDGLSDQEEKRLGTDPLKRDTDDDGLADGKEVGVYRTDPLKRDTDDDGFNDWDEIWSGFDPLSKSGKLPDQDSDGLADLYEIDNYLDRKNPDMDGDNLSDGDEIRIYGTDPKNADTDSDGFNDSDVLRGYDPLGTGKLTLAAEQKIAGLKAKYGQHPPPVE
ncbi:MAG: hypothetical protein WCT10_03130 [Patescibacteria group bacterium]|jgi:hypothetical protein